MADTTAGARVDRPLRILVFGAHPDDCDSKAGGSAALWARAGHRVRFVSLTNGDAGHHEIGGVELARRRREETQAAAAVIGIEYVVLDNHDAELMPTLENRRQVIRQMREFRPDLVLGPRPWDYHPDHRYTGMLVQDAAYVVTVPNVDALTPHLETNPYIMYMADGFQKPYPFTPDIAIAIDETVEQKLEMLHRHTSQMYEWLPYNGGVLHEVPPANDEAARRRWLWERRLPGYAAVADRYRNLLVRWYGPERGRQVRYAEAFEACEYGARLDEQALRRLFPL